MFLFNTLEKRRQAKIAGVEATILDNRRAGNELLDHYRKHGNPVELARQLSVLRNEELRLLATMKQLSKYDRHWAMRLQCLEIKDYGDDLYWSQMESY